MPKYPLKKSPPKSKLLRSSLDKPVVAGKAPMPSPFGKKKQNPNLRGSFVK
jgi:hypothetical protein